MTMIAGLHEDDGVASTSEAFGSRSDPMSQTCSGQERQTSNMSGIAKTEPATTCNAALLSAITSFLAAAGQQTESQQHLVAMIRGIIDGHDAASKASLSSDDKPRTERIHITKRKLSDIIQFVLENLEERIDLLDICRVAGLSASHLCRVMKIDTGLTPYSFVLRVRVDCARQMLLTTKLPLAEIALACGFSNQSHFCTTFKKFTGQTPGQFRRMAAAMIAATVAPVRNDSHPGCDLVPNRFGFDRTSVAREQPPLGTPPPQPHSAGQPGGTPS